tara:strand:- start:6 stop:410 length:405 start_codon:yes stop_codon:yes gene_type:complete
MIKPEKNEGCTIRKGWGEELIIENNDMYCGKILLFDKGSKFSMHYHMNKDETWYVEFGEFIYRWIDTKTAKLNEMKLKAGDVVRQRPGQPHQLEVISKENSRRDFVAGKIFEVSTYHEDADSYRVIKGDSQNDN